METSASYEARSAPLPYPTTRYGVEDERALLVRHEPARQQARELANTAAFASSQRARKKVEALFAELKHRMGVPRLRLRRLKFVREQFFLAAAAQNIRRLVRFLSQTQQPRVLLTT
jgi:hypothetical protein